VAVVAVEVLQTLQVLLLVRVEVVLVATRVKLLLLR
jgi:hypothetical protein